MHQGSYFIVVNPLFLDDDNYQLTDDGLRIKNVDMSMNDTFWCRADVLETGESRDFSISVIVSSKVSMQKKPLEHFP